MKPASTALAASPLDGARRRSVALAAPFVVWFVVCLARGERRWDLTLVTAAVVLLAASSDTSRRLLRGLYPVALLGLVYDGMRFVKDVGLSIERVHVCDLRALEMVFFSVDVDGVRGTAHDWFRAHPSTALDLVCAIPYGTFLVAAIGFAIFLYLRDDAAMRAFAWTFLALNLVAFVTYHVYPAAPPWYFHAHGCAADLSTRASEGPSLAHVDALTGIPYFRSFYGRSNSVFGAVPSLHVAYPLLILLHGYRFFGPVGRTLAALFFALMCFAAVYLDHHWILDVLLGVSYTLIVHLAVRALSARDSEPSEAGESAPVGDPRGA